MSLLSLTTHNPVIPVVVLDRSQDAINAGTALLDGGITTAEVTFRTKAAADAIRAMSDIPGLTVGAGTITKPADVDRAITSGARYIVSPGFNVDVVRASSSSRYTCAPRLYGWLVDHGCP